MCALPILPEEILFGLNLDVSLVPVSFHVCVIFETESPNVVALSVLEFSRAPTTEPQALGPQMYTTTLPKLSQDY